MDKQVAMWAFGLLISVIGGLLALQNRSTTKKIDEQGKKIDGQGAAIADTKLAVTEIKAAIFGVEGSGGGIAEKVASLHTFRNELQARERDKLEEERAAAVAEAAHLREQLRAADRREQRDDAA
jgi:hypothetical protein